MDTHTDSTDEEDTRNDRKPRARGEGRGQGLSPITTDHAHHATATATMDDNIGSSPRVKPALKKERKVRDHRPRQLKWDEAAIEEHDQLRGTRMKIDEPNTPYAQYDSGAESDDSRRAKSPAADHSNTPISSRSSTTISWDTLQNRLDTVKAVQEAYPSSPSVGDAEHSDVEDERRKEMRELEFKEHRKRHYNEMELVKKFRQEHPEGLMPDVEAGDGDDDDDDDDDQADDEKEDDDD